MTAPADEAREAAERLLKFYQGTMTTPQDERELRALVEKATPGPWYAYPGGVVTFEPGDPEADPIDEVSVCRRHDNNRLIAASRNALPALLDRLEKMRGALTDLLAAEDAVAQEEYGDDGMEKFRRGDPYRWLSAARTRARNALSQGEVNKDQTT